MHDRACPPQLKWFSKKNLNVSRQPMKEQRLREGDSVFTTSEFNWAELSDLRHTQDAIINYGIVCQNLWPMDQTPWILLKLYSTYGWLQYGITEKKRSTIICDHFDRIMANNADRAVGKLPPCDFFEQERILKLILAEEGLTQAPPITAGVSTEFGNRKNGGNGQQNQNGGKNSGGCGGRQQNKNKDSRPPAVCPNGRKVCFAYNRPAGCSNPPSNRAAGCQNSTTKMDYAHVCNEWIEATKTYCLKSHPRTQH